MKSYEWMAAAGSQRTPQKLEELVRRGDLDLFRRLTALTAGVFAEDMKEIARDAYRDLIRAAAGNSAYEQYRQTKVLPVWQVFEREMTLDVPALMRLPQPVWIMQFHFQLAKPLLSRDDDLVHPLDNPMRKEAIFKLPMIAASAWKGLLRNCLWTAVLRKLSTSSEAAAEELVHLVRLAGSLKDEKIKDPVNPSDRAWNEMLEKLEPKLRSLFEIGEGDVPNMAGCLHFYPTFFQRLDLEIINPHDRERRVGKNPILIESVPAGDSSLFQLFYLQTPCWANDQASARKLAAMDAARVAASLNELFHEIGFSAKRSSGYGAAEETLPEIDGYAGRFFANFYPSQPALQPVFTFTSLAEFVKQTERSVAR
jgi:CRISPR-associated protein Cmr2